MTSDITRLSKIDMAGFDIIASITQDTINYQLSHLFKTGVIHHQLEVVAESKPEHMKTPVDVTLSAKMAAPTVEIIDGDGHRPRLMFCLHLTHGTLASSLMENLEFSDWMYAFTVDLDMKEIERKALAEHRRIPLDVKAHLEAFAAEMFSIQHLFMDFQNADLASFDRARSRCPLPDSWGGGDLLTSSDPGLALLQLTLQAYFRGLAGGDNPYILAYAAAARAAGPKGTLEPTGATFMTTYRATAPKMSSLDMLIMTDHHEMPGAGAQPGELPAAATDADGWMVIAQRNFFDGWLIPRFMQGLATRAEPSDYWDQHNTKKRDTPSSHIEAIEPLSWRLQFSEQYYWVYPDRVPVVLVGREDLEFKYDDVRAMSVTIDTGSAHDVAVRVDGSIAIRMENFYSVLGIGYTLWNSARVQFSGVINLSGGTDGALGIAATLTPGEIQSDEHVQFGIMNVGEWMKRHKDEFVGKVQWVQDNLKASMADLRTRFLLPAGNIFFYKDPQVDGDGNLRLALTYKM